MNPRFACVNPNGAPETIQINPIQFNPIQLCPGGGLEANGWQYEPQGAQPTLANKRGQRLGWVEHSEKGSI